MPPYAHLTCRLHTGLVHTKGREVWLQLTAKNLLDYFCWPPFTLSATPVLLATLIHHQKETYLTYRMRLTNKYSALVMHNI
jgi:hypothetical protein